MTPCGFYFLSCLRSPASTNSYEQVEHLFEASARSALNQGLSDTRVVAVGNKAPAFCEAHPGIEFHEVKLGVPKRDTAHDDAINLDKGLKRLVGLGHALTQGAKYIAMLDADDLVANRLVETIETEDAGREPVSRFLSDGYVLDLSNGLTQVKYGMQRYCGSSIVYSAAALEGVFNLDGELEPRALFEANRDRARLIIDLLGNHKRPVGWLVSQGLPIRKHTGKDIAWVINNGTNLVGSYNLPSGRPLSEELCKKFSLTDSSVTTGSEGHSWIESLRGTAQSTLSRLMARHMERRTYRVGDPGPPKFAKAILEPPE